MKVNIFIFFLIKVFFTVNLAVNSLFVGSKMTSLEAPVHSRKKAPPIVLIFAGDSTIRSFGMRYLYVVAVKIDVRMKVFFIRSASFVNGRAVLATCADPCHVTSFRGVLSASLVILP